MITSCRRFFTAPRRNYGLKYVRVHPSSMGSTEIKSEVTRPLFKVADKFEAIFDLQRRFQTRMETTYDQAFITEMTLAAIVELTELVQETDWKSWKTPIGIQREKAVEEWADALHFFVNIGLALGLDADAAFDAYLAKNKENHARQDRGY